VKKLVHSPGEDLRLLHSLGCYPKNLMDTEVIAKLLNYEQTSLARMLELKLGISLNKKQQQSNWHLRPLTNEQLKYAADDVLHLPHLFDILMEEATAKGLVPFVEEEAMWLQTVKYTLEPKTNFLKPGDLKNLSDWQQYVMNETFKLRDKIAQVKNKPAFMIMPEPTVRDIALGYANYGDPAKLPGLHPSLRHGLTANEFVNSIEQIFDKANDLKLNKRIERVYFTDEEMKANRLKKDWQIRLKEKVLEPIQKAMIAKLGEFTTRYIISNGWITKWLNGEVKWANLQPAYKRRLIHETGTELGLEMQLLQEYEETFNKTP
jgi:ribonuclease D